MTTRRGKPVEESQIVRWPDGSLDVLADLAGHSDLDIRSTVLDLLNLQERPDSVEGMLDAARRFVDRLPVDSNFAGHKTAMIDTSPRWVLLALALHDSAPPALLEALASVHTPDILRVVAAHRDAPSSVLRALAQNEASEVREAVAKNPSTPSESLGRLAKDDDRWVRTAVAGNPNTPIEDLVRLAGDVAIDVRSEVAQSSMVSEDNRLALAVALAQRYAGDPDGLLEAVYAVLELGVSYQTGSEAAESVRGGTDV